MMEKHAIKRIRIKPFGDQGNVKVIGASGGEISFKKILGMKLLMLGVKQEGEELELYLELTR